MLFSQTKTFMNKKEILETLSNLKIDPVIHQPTRLRIMTALMNLGAHNAIEFTALRDLLNLTDGNIGAHLNRLEIVGYIRLEKHFSGTKWVTNVKLTQKGVKSYNKYTANLLKILTTPDYPAP